MNVTRITRSMIVTGMVAAATLAGIRYLPSLLNSNSNETRVDELQERVDYLENQCKADSIAYVNSDFAEAERNYLSAKNAAKTYCLSPGEKLDLLNDESIPEDVADERIKLSDVAEDALRSAEIDYDVANGVYFGYSRNRRELAKRELDIQKQYDEDKISYDKYNEEMLRILKKEGENLSAFLNPPR